MEHQIDYLYDAGKSYFIEIDGKKLEITKRLNKFDFLDPAKLSMFIDTLHDRLIRGEPIADLASTLNGASMFQILAHLYEDETFEYWVRDYARCIDSGISHFRDIFAHCFGFHYSSGHRKPTKLEDRMREYASALGIRIFYNSKVFYKEKVTQEELRLLNIARSSHYFVQEKGVEGSKVVFDINGIDISIGLSGKKRMHSADRVLQALEQLRVGLTLKDYETLMKGISALGKKASQAIISSFLRPEMEEYLKHLVHEIVVTNREPLYPASVVKAILGSFRSPYFNELLALLESFIPKVQDYLIDTSPQEMLAETDDWKIYGLVGGTFRQYQISFYGTPQLKTQVRSFLYAKAKPRVACQTEYACYIFTLAYYINLALAILDVELSIRIESILDLQPADVKMLTAFLAQHTNFAVKTQKNIIEEFRAFYNFCAPNKKASPFKRVQIPKKVNNPISDELNAAQKNNILRGAAALLSVAADYGVLSGTGVIDCSFRFSEPRQTKRAPDKCVSDALDSIFFDMRNDIPLAMRGIYMVLRLIPTRIGEVLSMNLDCITYPAQGVFSISIPTYKETPYHIPVFSQYNRLLDGYCEGLLYSTLRQQQNAVRAQRNLSERAKGYLFVAPSGSLVTTGDFNSFLQEIVTKNHILTAAGKPARVTSHDLRHIAIGERLRGDIISPEMTMVESNHHSVSQTMGYGYQSTHDEAIHLGAISDTVLSDAFGITSAKPVATSPSEVNPRKYAKLKAMPQTRILPGYGLCCNPSCSPRFMQCLSCQHFEPDSIYLEYFEEAARLVENRIETLRAKKGDPKAIASNEALLVVYRSYVDKLTSVAQDDAAAVS